MFRKVLHGLRWPLLGAAVSALILTTTTALAGSGVNGIFNLGVSNTVNTTTSLSGTTAGAQLKVVNEDASNHSILAQAGGGSGIALYGKHTTAAGTGPALRGDSASTAANAFSVYGLLSSTSSAVGSAAVRGQNGATNGNGYGVYGSHAGSGIGVFGTSLKGIGVNGMHTATSGTLPGVSASTNSTAAHANAVVATVAPTKAGLYSTAVVGINNDTSAPPGQEYGVFGSQAGAGIGVLGESDTGAGVVAINTNTLSGGNGIEASSLKGWAGYFTGEVFINGNLTVSGHCTGCTGPSLRIDDPLDPPHSYLQHSSVSSPDMLDIYSGNVTTDGKGFANVQMPSYFQALNRSFRYQLTVVGRSFARAIVWSEIAGNRFTIRTDQPNVKVSWQVSGIRHDRYANAHRVKAVLEKPAAERGKYLHPELYGKPSRDAIGFERQPGIPRQPVHRR